MCTCVHVCTCVYMCMCVCVYAMHVHLQVRFREGVQPVSHGPPSLQAAAVASLWESPAQRLGPLLCLDPELGSAVWPPRVCPRCSEVSVTRAAVSGRGVPIGKVPRTVLGSVCRGPQLSNSVRSGGRARPEQVFPLEVVRTGLICSRPLGASLP